MGAQEVLSPEERCERVRMALAELGYRDAFLLWNDEHGVGLDFDEVPAAVGWRAWAVAGEPLACWPCWSTNDHATVEGCDHDPLTSPWPEVVR